MIVLPWPGVSACAAPSAIAVMSDRIRIGGVRSSVSSRPEISAPTPPGTAARAEAADAAGTLPHPNPGESPLGALDSGKASAMHGAAKAGPPGDALKVASPIASG